LRFLVVFFEWKKELRLRNMERRGRTTSGGRSGRNRIMYTTLIANEFIVLYPLINELVFVPFELVKENS
jgi:hypothetical protein